MQTILEKIKNVKMVPVIALERVEDAAPLARALTEGGLPCAEVTFRFPDADKCIMEMKKACPEMFVGAGTILTTEQVDRAVAAGAKFIVSPGLNPRIVKYCVEKGIVITPGCANASDMEQALENGLEVVKFFPAEPAGGLNMIKALAAPYVGLKFMPTGGISPKNVRDYLAYDRIIACGGSWMVKNDLVKAGDFAAITELAKECVQIVKESRGE